MTTFLIITLLLVVTTIIALRENNRLANIVYAIVGTLILFVGVSAIVICSPIICIANIICRSNIKNDGLKSGFGTVRHYIMVMIDYFFDKIFRRNTNIYQ